MQRGEGAEKNKNEEYQQSAKYGCWEWFALSSGAIFLLAVVSAVVCGFIILRLSSGTHWPEDFCTVEDTVYRTLAENGDAWLRRYFGDGETIQTSKSINVLGAGEYLLLAENGRLYIRVVWAPRFRFGKAGYIYSTYGIPRMGPDDEITHLEGNVYCYVLDNPG